MNDLLQAGIAAIRKGDKAQGRELLLQVLQTDDHNEQAWLWLSAAMETVDDQILALENVLTINPQNVHARARLEQLRPPPSSPALPPLGEGRAERGVRTDDDDQYYTPPRSGIDWDDDPMDCVYCGKPVPEREFRCPSCNHSLLQLREENSTRFRYFVFLLFAVNLQAALIQVVGPMAGIAHNAGLNDRAINIASQWEAVRVSLGNFMAYTKSQSEWYFGFSALRFFYLVAASAGIYTDWTYGYHVAISMLVADIIYSLIASNFYLAPGMLFLNLGVNAAIIAMCIMGIMGQNLNRKRLYLEPDKDAQVGFEAFRRGERYAQRKMLALAAIHYKRAIIKDGKRKEYYTRLAETHWQLSRKTLARNTLEQGLMRFPKDAELTQMLQHLQKKMTP